MPYRCFSRRNTVTSRLPVTDCSTLMDHCIEQPASGCDSVASCFWLDYHVTFAGMWLMMFGFLEREFPAALGAVTAACLLHHVQHRHGRVSFHSN